MFGKCATQRRILAVLLQLLGPLSLPLLSSYLRRRIERLSSSEDPADSSRIQRLERLSRLTQNQVVQAIPEIWLTWWLIGGSRMLDVGRWLTGMDYVGVVVHQCSVRSLISRA